MQIQIRLQKTFTHKRISLYDCICQSTLHKWRLFRRREYNSITKSSIAQKNAIDDDSLSLFNIYITSQFFSTTHVTISTHKFKPIIVTLNYKSGHRHK